jgi:hypothetical protein
MQQTRIAFGIAASMGLMACSPSFAPPNAPTAACQAITQNQFDSAIDAGAAIGRGKISANGATSLVIGAGTSHCTKVPAGKRTCIRPNDFAIEYKLSDDRLIYVLIPKQTQYRFNVTARPTPCEVIAVSP